VETIKRQLGLCMWLFGCEAIARVCAPKPTCRFLARTVRHLSRRRNSIWAV